MPNVANYDVVQDTAEVISDISHNRDFPLETPGIDVATRALLSYMIDAMEDIRFEIFVINAKSTKSLGVVVEKAGSGHVRQEVLDVGILQPKGNMLRIEVTKGSGKFSDIMLWYQVKV